MLRTFGTIRDVELPVEPIGNYGIHLIFSLVFCVKLEPEKTAIGGRNSHRLDTQQIDDPARGSGKGLQVSGIGCCDGIAVFGN